MQVWNSIKGSEDPNDFRTFLDAYPQSPMAPFAKNRLRALQGGGETKKIAKVKEEVTRAPTRPTKVPPRISKTPDKIPSKFAMAPPSRISKTMAPDTGIMVDKPTFGAGEKVTVHFFGLPGNPQDWITVVPEGTAEDQWGNWTYTKGKRDGSWTTGPLSPGRYEVRLYFDWPKGQFTVHGRRKFRVK